jgi:ribonuclease PH
MRHSGRTTSELRKIEIETNIIKNAEGSCYIKFGNTHIICTASIDDSTPHFLRGTNKGWVTAEYGMLPRSTHSRMKREAAQGRQSGRTQEIQRLIGRSLRAAVNLELLPEKQITIDCDVIQADGGTRTAAITGGYIALHQAVEKLMKVYSLGRNPIVTEIAAISCGIVNGEVMLDLDYNEDSTAEVDANFVMNSHGKIIEVQATAENASFTDDQFLKMIQYARISVKHLISLQRKALKIDGYS